MTSRYSGLALFRYGLTLVLLIGLFALPTSCSAGEDEKPQDLSSLLPDKDLPAGFDHKVSETVYDRAKIWDYIGPNSDVYLYNGFQNLLVARYDNGAGDTLDLNVFEFSTPLEAFALYSNLREYWHPDVEQLAEGYLNGDTLTWLKGNYLGRLHSPAIDPTELVPAAAEMCGEISADIKKQPEFIYFPQGYLPHSERVTLDDFLGQTELDDFRSAAYVLGADTLRLYMHLSADNLLAEVVRAYMGGSGVVKEMIFDGYTQGFVAENAEFGSLILKIKGQILVMMIGQGDREAIDNLMRAAFARVEELGPPGSAETEK